MTIGGLLKVFLLPLCFDLAVGTKCYVCGGESALAAKCVDDYPTDLRAEDIKDCVDYHLDHTVGCTKAKYVDPEGHQIVSRSCAPEVGMKADNECKNTEVNGHEVHYCHCLEDMCNHSPPQKLNAGLLTIAAATSVLAWSLCS